MSTGPRDTIADRLGGALSPRAKALASYLKDRGDAGELPCWGAIHEHLGELLEQDEDWLEVWEAVAEVGNRHALLVFLHAARTRPAVMREVLRGAGRLPMQLQLALVTFEEVAPLVPEHLEQLDPTVQQLWKLGPKALGSERRLVKARLSRLLVSRYFVPMRRDPADEPALQGGTTENAGDGR